MENSKNNLMKDHTEYEASYCGNYDRNYKSGEWYKLQTLTE